MSLCAIILFNLLINQFNNPSLSVGIKCWQHPVLRRLLIEHAARLVFIGSGKQAATEGEQFTVYMREKRERNHPHINEKECTNWDISTLN